jgi:hypothetical protein
MERHEHVVASKKHIFFNNFLGGVAWGIGATIGATIIVAVLTFILREINLIPFVGDFVTNIAERVLQNLHSTPYLLK